MHHVIELHLDQETERLLKKATDRIQISGLDQSEKIEGVRPHITLCSSKPLSEKVISELAVVFSSYRQFKVEYSYIGLFTKSSANPILYAGVSPSAELCNWQEKIYSIVKDAGCVPFEFVRPGFMVFHSTLSNSFPANNLQPALEILRDTLPLEATVIRAAVVEYYPALEKRAFEFNE